MQGERQVKGGQQAGILFSENLPFKGASHSKGRREGDGGERQEVEAAPAPAGRLAVVQRAAAERPQQRRRIVVRTLRSSIHV